MSKLKYYDGTDWKIVNGQVTGDTLPIGAIVPFGGWDAPTGWLICDGTLLNKTDYPELFNAIGYSFGGEEGGSTFGLPDLRGRVPLGLKETDTDFNGMGLTGGEKKHTLTVAEMPSHNHLQRMFSENYNDGKSIVANRAYARSFADTAGGWNWSGSGKSNGQIVDTIETNNRGNDNAHNNLQPYQTVNYIIKAKQSAGVVANVSNTYSTSQSDTYSCDYINGIIESGSNTNGSYTKYADGTLINRGFIGPVTTNAGAGANTLVTYPMAFVDTDYSCTVSISNSQAYWAEINHCVNGKTTTTFNLQTWNRGSYANTGQYFNYIAIGKWK